MNDKQENTDPALLRNDWSVFTKSHSGAVSFVRNLDLALAVKLYDECETHRTPNVVYYVNGSDIVDRKIFGPPEWGGCRRAMRHSIEFGPVVICDGGPNVGKAYHSGTCAHCGEYAFKWVEEIAAK